MESRAIKYNGPSIHGTKVKIRQTKKGYHIWVMAMSIIDVAMCMMLAIEQVTERRYTITSLMQYAKEAPDDGWEDDDGGMDFYTGTAWIDQDGNLKNSISWS